MSMDCGGGNHEWQCGAWMLDAFRIETPVTKEVLLYAIETTFRLNGLLIVPSGKSGVSLQPIKPGKGSMRPGPRSQ